MAATKAPQPQRPARESALEMLALSAAGNIPGVDFVSITLREGVSLRTVAATDPVARQADSLQYELHEGPCYSAVTDERFVLVNDLASSAEFPRYGPRAVELGVGAQAAIQLMEGGRQRAGLNLYAYRSDAFDRYTVQFAELFATQTSALLGYAEQVEQLSEGLHTRTDIGTAVGILMERYGIDRHQAFAFLTRSSQLRNTKVRFLARQVIDGTFESTTSEDDGSQVWP